jgi:CBS-domain-containing membrane protein
MDRRPVMPMTVEDVMTRNVVAIRELAAVRDVTLLVREHHVSALQVVDGNGQMVGVVSESDLLLKRVGHRTTGCELCCGEGFARWHGPRRLGSAREGS